MKIDMAPFGIKSRLVALVVAIFIPFIALAGFGLWDLWRKEHAQAMERALVEARLITGRIDDHVRKLELLLLGTSKSLSLSRDDAARNDTVLQEIRSNLPSYIANINLFDLDGHNIGTSSFADRSTLYAGDRLYFQAALRGHQLAVGEPILARSSGNWTLSLARPLRDAQGNIVAVLAVGTLLERLHEVASSRPLPPGSVVTILNEKGRVLGRSVGGPEWINRDLSNLARVAAHHPSKEVSTVGVWADGIVRITGTAPATAVPWFVSVGLPENIALEEMTAQVQWALLVIAGALCMAIAMAWLFARQIVHPLRLLSADAKILAAGNLAHRSVVESRGEVGQLAKTLNRMAASVQQRQHEAEVARDEASNEAASDVGWRRRSAKQRRRWRR